VQPADIGRLVAVSDPKVSPDGRTVAFVVTRVDLEANRYRSSVWLAADDGSTPPYQLTAGEHGDGSPAWAPDGRRLAFTRSGSDDGTNTLHVIPVGIPGETLTLCTRPEKIGQPVWSPDGSRIAFVSRERTGRYADGDDEQARPPRRIDRLFSRLDGEGFIVDRPQSVFVVPSDGSTAPEVVAGGPYEHGDPSWSPDGTTLAVATTRSKDSDLEPVDDIHLVTVVPGADREPRPLTDRSLSHRHPAFGPDGKCVASLAEDTRVIPSHSQVVVTDIAGGLQRVVTAVLDRECAPSAVGRPPIWDGEHLLFSIEDHGDVHVYRVPADGSGDPERLIGGTRTVTGIDLAGGTLAFVAGTPTELAELFILDGDGTERRLTSLGAAFHAAVPTAAPEHFTVQSPADDGEIDAWLVRPAGGPAGERVPVLLSIHGGPMTQYPNLWFDEFQMWAGAGYAVVYCNPHGSTGGSEAWVQSIRPPEASTVPGTGWGGIDADDVLAVLDAALEREPLLDRDRVGVLGGSYGGYMTSWLIGHTDRFAAACSERAVNNLLTLETASDAAGLFRFEFGATHLDAPEAYLRMSPITYVRDIETPVLILHSEDDLRCPIEQADQLFIALRLLGKPVEYWRFPREGHELSRSGSPRHRVQRAEIILDWFGRHLGGTRPTIAWDHPSRV
jgi:dipeptidyl aminopeptidase/acylaminoacyl peptidase